MKWHELLGAVLMDFFEGTPYFVDPEVDLSLKKQRLDIVVIRKMEGELHRDLPDGMAPLAHHNLISFKSHQDTFDGWALLELVGHYVNYRKQASPSVDDLLPAEQFRLFGITARFPDKLAKDVVLEELQPGVYDISCGPIRIRLLVIRNLQHQPTNAMLKLFSIVPDQIEFACKNYRPHSPHSTSIIENLIRRYQLEDTKMAVTLEELQKKAARENLEYALQQTPKEEILKRIPLAEIEAYLRKIKNEIPEGTPSEPKS